MNLTIPGSARPALRTALVTVFATAMVATFLWLWSQMGGRLPWMSDGYVIEIGVERIDNLVPDGDVRLAGVTVGTVASIDPGESGTSRVTLRLEDRHGPLHDGATAQLRPKTLIGETYVQLVDGDGAAIEHGGVLPPDRTLPAVSLDDVLATLDEPTRAALSGGLRSLGEVTDGSSQEVEQLLIGLADLGRDGADALDILAAQSEDLQRLTRDTVSLLAALDHGEGRIAELVTQAHTVAEAAAAQEGAITRTVEQLPDVLTAASDGTQRLEELTTALQPVVADLDAAAPGLNRALVALQPTLRDVHALLPEFDGVLDAAPPTLERVPRLAIDVSGMTPVLRELMADINPMLGYLQPYGPDLSAFFAGLGNVVQWDEQGAYGRVSGLVNELSFRGYPIPVDVFDRSNAYPDPGSVGTGAPFRGSYPRVEKDPVDDDA
ncbi:MlaD family protein [Nitriliruptor alkaliphilus]|uniref:MlaD family protein n=1 Tax=Nitriliruptor alkaliphilus TaxID=427918 RepID=UPI000698197A|nr:MlaD family protein [Nitriliruptor alkaliphilus]